MPSDERLQHALGAMQERRVAFRAGVETAHAQVRAYLAAHAACSDERAQETALELGRFAGGRIDVRRFAAAMGTHRVLDAHEETLVRRCAEVMDEVLAHGDGLFLCEVMAGGDLHDTVESALAQVGRAFGAALVFQSVKAGVYRPEQHEVHLRAFPFRRWNRSERMIAPPLVVGLQGAELHAGALAEYLDGRQKVALVVDGPSTPAPLARLITPGTFVLQTDTPADLARLAAADAPGVAALLPPSAARFAHDPAARRLEVTHLRAEPPRRAVGGWSAWQQEEELALLRQLAAAEALAANAEDRVRAADAAPVVDVDALASWMLARAGLAGGGA